MNDDILDSAGYVLVPAGTNGPNFLGGIVYRPGTIRSFQLRPGEILQVETPTAVQPWPWGVYESASPAPVAKPAIVPDGSKPPSRKLRIAEIE